MFRQAYISPKVRELFRFHKVRINIALEGFIKLAFSSNNIERSRRGPGIFIAFEIFIKPSRREFRDRL